MSDTDKQQKKKISDFIPQLGKDLVSISRNEVIGKIGQDVIKEIVTSILTGGNVRSLTEGLTRRRLTLSNASILLAYLNSLQNIEKFRKSPFLMVKEEFVASNPGNEEKAYLNWMIGLSKKGIQNILRDDHEKVHDYLQIL
ncbi:MAG: hypothetical protein D6730_18280, partial [Bacteroidetes bacterium]